MVEQEYAKALYEISLEENKTKEFKEYFNAIKDTLEDDFLTLIASPAIIKEEKKKMVANIYHSFDETFINFLYVLIDHNRFNMIVAISKQYDKLILEHENILQVRIISAEPLTKAQLEKYKSTLEVKYGKTIEIINKVKPELIGGITVIVNGEALDVSVLHALNMLKESI